MRAASLVPWPIGILIFQTSHTVAHRGQLTTFSGFSASQIPNLPDFSPKPVQKPINHRVKFIIAMTPLSSNLLVHFLVAVISYVARNNIEEEEYVFMGTGHSWQ